MQEDPVLGIVHVKKGFFLRARPLLQRELVSCRGLASAASRGSKMAFPLLREHMLLVSRKIV